MDAQIAGSANQQAAVPEQECSRYPACGRTTEAPRLVAQPHHDAGAGEENPQAHAMRRARERGLRPGGARSARKLRWAKFSISQRCVRNQRAASLAIALARCRALESRSGSPTERAFVDCAALLPQLRIASRFLRNAAVKRRRRRAPVATSPAALESRPAPRAGAAAPGRLRLSPLSRRPRLRRVGRYVLADVQGDVDPRWTQKAAQ